MFSTSPQNDVIVKKSPFQSWFEKFSSQPHQSFFSSGAIFLILFIFALFLNYSGIVYLKVSLLIYHAYALIFVVFIQFFLGFLFVVFPRFLMQAEISSKIYMKQFYIYLFASVLFFISIFVSEVLTIFASFICFVAQLISFKTLYDIHNKSLMKVKDDTKWVLISFAFGLGANLLFILSFIDFSYSYTLKQISIYSGFYLFIFMLIFSIAQRMVPFFTTGKIPNYVINKSKNLLKIVFAFLVLKVILLILGKVELNLIADIPLFIIFTKELIKWKIDYRKVTAIMWVLYLALYWIPLGFLLSSVESIVYIINNEVVFEKAVIHIFALGFFSTILLGFGTRVVLGHSGNTPTANRFTTIIFLLFQVVVLLRVFAAYSINFGFEYQLFINISAVLFIVLFSLWGIKYLPYLLKNK